MASDWYGAYVRVRLHEAEVRALDMAAKHILEEANRTVPLMENIWDKHGNVRPIPARLLRTGDTDVDEADPVVGRLLRTGDTDVDEGELVASISYGTPYARRQHEELDYRHAPGRRAKWLERTLEERGDDVLEWMRAEIELSMRG